jgi:uncharacterized protein
MPTQTTTIGELDLLGWKRAVFELYAEVRSTTPPQDAWRLWRNTRDRLVRDHPCSPLNETQRETFRALPYHPYDPGMRVLATTVPADNAEVQVGTSTGGPYTFTRFAHAEFELPGGPQRLALYWLAGYGGGVFLPFADATNGSSTYGAGRYLLDTVKGADLGEHEGRLVLDFNFAYNPSCSYDPVWTCPLAPLENRLDLPVCAGELDYSTADVIRAASP